MYAAQTVDRVELRGSGPKSGIGARAYMRSTYDRAGGNERADASHFLYQEADDFNVPGWKTRSHSASGADVQPAIPRRRIPSLEGPHPG